MNPRMLSRAGPLTLACCVIAVGAAMAPMTTQTAALSIRTLSSRPDMASGGDALVEIRPGSDAPGPPQRPTRAGTASSAGSTNPPPSTARASATGSIRFI